MALATRFLGTLLLLHVYLQLSLISCHPISKETDKSGTLSCNCSYDGHDKKDSFSCVIHDKQLEHLLKEVGKIADGNEDDGAAKGAVLWEDGDEVERWLEEEKIVEEGIAPSKEFVKNSGEEDYSKEDDYHSEEQNVWSSYEHSTEEKDSSQWDEDSDPEVTVEDLPHWYEDILEDTDDHSSKKDSKEILHPVDIGSIILDRKYAPLETTYKWEDPIKSTTHGSHSFPRSPYTYGWIQPSYGAYGISDWAVNPSWDLGATDTKTSYDVESIDQAYSNHYSVFNPYSEYLSNYYKPISPITPYNWQYSPYIAKDVQNYNYPWVNYYGDSGFYDPSSYYGGSYSPLYGRALYGNSPTYSYNPKAPIITGDWWGSSGFPDYSSPLTYGTYVGSKTGDDIGSGGSATHYEDSAKVTVHSKEKSEKSSPTTHTSYTKGTEHSSYLKPTYERTVLCNCPGGHPWFS